MRTIRILEERGLLLYHVKDRTHYFVGRNFVLHELKSGLIGYNLFQDEFSLDIYSLSDKFIANCIKEKLIELV